MEKYRNYIISCDMDLFGRINKDLSPPKRVKWFGDPFSFVFSGL